MNNNNIEVNGRVKREFKELAAKIANEALILMGQPEGLEIAINFVSKREIKKINKEFRSINKVTDVLSFPSTNLKSGEIFNLKSVDATFNKTENGYIHFGDMALCTKKLKNQAKEFGNTFEEELKKLVIHSVLHLMGYDHIKDEDYEVMKKQEELLDKKIKI